MASDNEASCVSDPNFAVICSFLECFGKSCGISYPDIGKLQEMLEDNHDVPQQLIDLHIKLLRKTRKSVSPEKWEKALIKFCHTYSNQDGWEVERFGYKKVRVAVKVRLLKVLLESQFDLNQKFKNEVNKLSANELRLEPLGRDKTGQSYWFQLDDDCNIRVYREDLDEESWELVAQDRDGVVKLIATLSDGETGPLPINEDSNSLEISEKPITDTGQVSTSSPSVEDESIRENGDTNETPPSAPQKHPAVVDKPQNGAENLEDSEEDAEDEEDDEELSDEEEEEEEELSNEDSEDGEESQGSESLPLPSEPIKKSVMPLEKPPKLKVQEVEPPKPVEIKEPTKPSVIKSIETPVITTSPLKLLNLLEQRPQLNERIPELQIIPAPFKQHLEPPEKPKPLPFTIERSNPSKVSMKPIDKLAANLVRLQSEKLSNEKPGASKLVEKIAENLARSSGVHASVINGEERSRGIDLSTSPRGWESANDHNRPVDFSGMDLSSRKPQSYRSDIQSREMDLSTRKIKPEIPNLPYDPRASLLRNHAMIADLSKRQMSFSGYDVQTGSYHGARLPGKEEHRLPSYSMLPDPSKLASMRLGKRAFDADDQQAEMLKRLRTDLLPIRGGIERKTARREEVGAAIEEPLMMVQGEGSGSDCEAGNNVLHHSDEVGEAIEEVFYFYGEGNGNDCDTGNPGDETSNDNKDSNESKAESCSDVSQTKIDESGVKSVVNDCNDDKVNCQVGASGESPRAKFKPTLGVQVFAKSPGSSAKRLSRWDVRETDEKRECDSSIISCEENISNVTDHSVEGGIISGCRSEEAISSTTSQNAVSSSERLEDRADNEPESSSRNERRMETGDEPRFFFGPNCVSYTSEANKKLESCEISEGSQVNAVVSGSDMKLTDVKGPEPDSVPSESCASSGSVERIESSEDACEVSSLIDKSDMTPSTTSEAELPEPSEAPTSATRDEKVPESSDSRVTEEGDDAVTNSEASECRISDSGGSEVPIESSEACSTVDDEVRSEQVCSTEAEPVSEVLERTNADEDEQMETSTAENERIEEPEAASSSGKEVEPQLENVIDSTENVTRSDSMAAESPKPSELIEDSPEKMESNSEPIEVTAPVEIDETNGLKLSEPVNVVSVDQCEEKEVQKDLNDVEDAKSCSLDQDSSESMVIDDRTSDSNGSAKEIIEASFKDALEVDSSRENSKDEEIESCGDKMNESKEELPMESSEERRENIDEESSTCVPEELLSSPEAPISSSTKEEEEELDEVLEGIEPDSKPDERPEEVDFEMSEEPESTDSTNESKIDEKPEEIVTKSEELHEQNEPQIAEEPEEIESKSETEVEPRTESKIEEDNQSKEKALEEEDPPNVEEVLIEEETQVAEEPKLSESPSSIVEQKQEPPVATLSEEVNEISESSTPLDVESEEKASLVANYGSEDSTEVGSDDVFEAEVNPVEPDESIEEESIPEAPETVFEVPQLVPEAPKPIPEELQSKEAPEIVENAESLPRVDLSVRNEAVIEEEAPNDDKHCEEGSKTEDEIPVDEETAESPEDMFGSSKPDTPIEIDNQDIEKIAATLNEDDDEDDEPPQLIGEMQQAEISLRPEEEQEVKLIEPEESMEETPPQLSEASQPNEFETNEQPPVLNLAVEPQQSSPEIMPRPIIEETQPEPDTVGVETFPEVEDIPASKSPEVGDLPTQCLLEEPKPKPPELVELLTIKASVPEEPIPETLPLVINDHVEQVSKKDRDPDDDTPAIIHLSKRPRTEPEEPIESVIKTESMNFRNSGLTVDKILNLQPQKDVNSLRNPLEQKLDKVPVLHELESVKPVLEELKPLTVSVVSELPQELCMKAEIKKEASKRLHVELDSEDLPPLKSRPSNADFIKEEPLTNDIKPLDQKPPEIPHPSESIVKKREFDFKPQEQQFPNHLESKPIVNEQFEDPFKPSATVITPMKISDDSEDSMGIDNECMYEPPVNNVDPLELNEHDLAKTADLENTDPKLGIQLKPVSEFQYEGWKLETTDISTQQKVSRKRRNSTHESNSEDVTRQDEDEDENMGGKRRKLRGKRTPDMKLRKSIEESRIEDVSSDDEPLASVVEAISEMKKKNEAKEGSGDQTDKKPKVKTKGRKRRGFKKRRPSTTKKVEPSATERPEDGPEGVKNEGATPAAQKKRKKRKMVLGLEIGIDIVDPSTDQAIGGEAPVRQSRRIAQIKIKEEADRRRIEDEALNTMKGKKDQKEKKKRKKHKESDEEVVIKEVEKSLKETKSQKKRKKRKKKEAKFNEAKPWQSSSGSSSDDEDHEEEEEEEEIESEGSLLFKSDHEFSPESDLEKDAEPEPMRRARTAQKSDEGVVEAEDEYACQKCGKADHPEWILLCDTCDKGWHCSCLRPALMLIPEGDWFCPPCQHNLLLNKLRESLKTYDQHVKKHENEIMRKKRLAYVGISLDNVLPKNEVGRRSSHREMEDSSESEDNDEGNSGSAAGSGSDEESSTSSSSGSATSSSDSSSEESEPVYQLRERRCANTYKFNEYDDMINAAIQDEVEAVQGAGNQGRGKDISTIVNAEKEEAQVETFDKQNEGVDEEAEKQSDKESDKEFTVDKDAEDEEDNEEEKKKVKVRKMLGKKKHRKLNSLDISSEDDPESDEDFKGTSSDEEEDYEDQLVSSDDSFTETRRRGKRGDKRPVRRSTRAARRQTYDEDFINDDSDDSDRPKRKKSRSAWDESESEDSDNSWRQRKKRGNTSSLPRLRATVKSKAKKKKKRKRIVHMESDNQSDNENEEEAPAEVVKVPQAVVDKAPAEEAPPEVPEEPEAEPKVEVPPETAEEVVEEKDQPQIPIVPEPKPELAPSYRESAAPPQQLPLQPEVPAVTLVDPPQEPVITEQLIQPPILQEPEKKERKKREKGIRRKIIYGGLPEDRPPEDDEPLGRRTRGRKINYQVDAIMSDSEEELKKALRKTEDSEDEFVMHIAEDVKEDPEKDSDSADDEYSPQKNAASKHKSPKNRRSKKSPAGGKSATDNGEPKQRKKPGPKPGSKNKPRTPKSLLSGSLDGSGIGDVGEGSLSNLASEDLGDLNEEQLAQMMMEDEEYGRRQLELAAIEIAKNKKKEEREAKKLEKARLKALEILAAEQQRDPNAPDGTDGEAPKKKKRGRRSKAEILAEQMRRGADPAMAVLPNVPAAPVIPMTVNPIMTTMPPTALPGTGLLPSDMERPEAHLMAGQMITGLDGHMLNPDGTPMRPKRRGRGKGKKTLAMEAAKAAEAAKSGFPGDPDYKHDDMNVLPTPGSSTSGSAPSTPPAIAVTQGGLPVTQSSNPQSVYPQLPSQQSSVITRMLQSQPISSSAPQSFTAAAAAMGQKYFGVPNATGPMMPGPRGTYDLTPRGRIPSPYNSRQPGGPLPPHFAAVRSGTPPMRMRVPGPAQLYHSSHHPMDPSPSGGGPISITSRDRSSPLGPGPAMIPPAAGSPLAKGGPTPPPPPYVRAGPLSRFAENPQISRHPIPTFTTAAANHSIQQPSPPPNRPGNFSPYHPQPPPNYHYGAYPPPPPMSTADDAAAYQGSPYSSEHFSTQPENPPAPPATIQAPPPPPQTQTTQSSTTHPPTPHPPPHPPSAPGAEPGAGKQYDEEGTGEFGGLVSYFSSQREDDLDS